MSDSLLPHGLRPPGSSVCGISQARILEWVAISFSRGSFQPTDLNLCTLRWQANSLTVSHQGSPLAENIYKLNIKGVAWFFLFIVKCDKKEVNFSFFLHVRTQWDDDHCKLGRETLPELGHACLHPHFILPELWENTFVLFKSPSLWYFIMTAWANEYNDQLRFIPQVQDWLHIKKSVNVLYHINRTKEENHMRISISSAQFSHSVMFDSLRPHELQHARPPDPSPTPGVHSHSRPSSRWCHAAISSSVIPFSSSVIPFSSCPQSLPVSESFPMSQLFAWGGPSIGVSALASFLPKNTQDWSPLEWTGWISLQSKGLSRVSSNTTVQKHQFFGAQLSSQSNSHIHTRPQEKP